MGIKCQDDASSPGLLTLSRSWGPRLQVHSHPWLSVYTGGSLSAGEAEWHILLLSFAPPSPRYQGKGVEVSGPGSSFGRTFLRVITSADAIGMVGWPAGITHDTHLSPGTRRLPRLR